MSRRCFLFVGWVDEVGYLSASLKYIGALLWKCYHIASMSQCSVPLLLYRKSRIYVGSLVTYVCVCGGITSLGFAVDWTSSSLSRVDLSGLSWHRSCPGHLWEAAVIWAPAYSAVYLCLCLAIKRRVLQHRVIFFTPWKHSSVPGYPLARVTASLSLCQGIPQYPQ